MTRSSESSTITVCNHGFIVRSEGCGEPGCTDWQTIDVGALRAARDNAFVECEAARALAQDLTVDRADALSALRVIRGPADGQDVWMDAYREAGGGYGGLQAVAQAALEAIERREAKEPR